MKKKIVMLAIILLTAGLLFAYEYVFGGSNLPIYSGYPTFKTFFTVKPYSTTVTEFEYDSYRNDVVDYVDDAETYIDNAYNDIKRILNEIEAAESAANEAVNDFNSWSRTVTVKSGYGFY